MRQRYWRECRCIVLRVLLYVLDECPSTRRSQVATARVRQVSLLQLGEYSIQVLWLSYFHHLRWRQFCDILLPFGGLND